MYSKILIASLSIFLYLGCNPKNKTSHEVVAAKPSIEVPNFNADSAYHYTDRQVAFGPRVPNTEAHTACGDFFVEKLQSFGAEVIEQKMDVTTYDGKILKARNIIASYQKEKKNRVLLFAHWDTRPFADHDPDPSNHRKAIDGANDGAGACGILLEIARQTNIHPTEMGIDIIFFDAEDWGVPTFEDKYNSTSGYCLGSNYWAKNPHVNNYTARYGILLDMVSAPKALFFQEHYSRQYAPNIVKKVWDAAHSLGFGSRFIREPMGAIEDDHIHVIKHRNIPCIDIIDYDPNSEKGFGDYWHTMEDNMSNISKQTMQMVGQTVLHVIYNEKE